MNLLIAAIVFSAVSAGPVRQTTVIDRPHLEALFPKLAIKDSVDKQGDAEWDTLSVYRGKEELLQISPCDAGPLGKVCIVYSRSKSARTADGVRIGETYAQAKAKVHACGAGFNQDSDKVLCEAASAKNVTVVFGKKGAKEGMPKPPELATYRVEELRWVP
jgi:hypothetical protein